MEFSVSHSIEVLSATPATLRALLGNLSDEWTLPIAHPSSESAGSDEVNSAVGDGGSEIRNPQSEIQNREWQPYDIVGHLIHAELTDWIPRARIILDQSADPTFVPFDRFAQFENSKGKSLVQLLDEFTKLRAENLDTLRSWNLTDELLELEGNHPELGRVKLRELLATWLVHDLTHIRQIVTVMAKRYELAVGVWKEYLSILK
jgi:hypothetical protein